METILLDDFIDEGIIREKSFREKINTIDFNKFADQKVIIKGCAGVTVPTWAYLILVDWPTYFMNIAKEVSTRSTCDRKHVGAVIVRDKTILSTGYNGSIKGLQHCDEIGHEMVDGHCIRTTHAEANAIVQAAKNGVSINNSEIYVTASPCYHCFKLIANSGIKTIYYDEFYRDDRIMKYATEADIELKALN